MKNNKPNRETKRAIELANLGVGLHTVKNVDELFEDINKEPDELALKTAVDIIKSWKIICVPIENGFYGHCEKLKQVFGDGNTKKECIKDTKEALSFALSYILETEEEKILGDAADRITKENKLIPEEEFYRETDFN